MFLVIFFKFPDSSFVPTIPVIVYTISSDATLQEGDRLADFERSSIRSTFELLYFSVNKSEWKRLNGACGTSKTESELENLKKNEFENSHIFFLFNFCLPKRID